MPANRIVLCGTRAPLHERRWDTDAVLRIGTRPNLEVVLNDPSVSPRHAEVFLAEDGWMVRDLGSRQGTFVNGIRVGPAGRKLHPGDEVRCGDVGLRVAALEEDDSLLTTSDMLVRIQAVTHRSWEQALESLADYDLRHLGQGKHFLTLLRAGYHLRHLTSLDELMQSILDDAVKVLNAQRGAIVLADGPGGKLELRTVSVARPTAGGARAYSRTLAQRAFARGESLLCQDVSRDAEMAASHSTRLKNMASVICALLRSPRRQLGVLHLDRGPLQEPFTEEDFFLADAIAASVSAAIESAQLLARQRDLFLQTVNTLARAVELRDHYTGGHTQRVTEYALLLAEELRLSPAEQEQIKVGTPLHDIGKIGVSDTILQKPGRLTAAEFEVMKEHTTKGAAILQTIPDLLPMIPIVRHHHERWDGRGYPDRLAGEVIPPVARVVAVADAFDAMVTDRPYRPALSMDRAFAEIGEQAGRHFAPDCAGAFLRLRPRIEVRRN